MKKQSIYLTLLLAFTAALATGGQVQRPNVVIIMPDDLSYSDFSYYNYYNDVPRTPNIDQLGGERAVNRLPRCADMFTWLVPNHVGALLNL